MFGDNLQIKALHKYDCLRANKSTSAFGLEARVPFLDKDFINTAMSLDPESKMVTTKLTSQTQYLPSQVNVEQIFYMGFSRSSQRKEGSRNGF